MTLEELDCESARLLTRRRFQIPMLLQTLWHVTRISSGKFFIESHRYNASVCKCHRTSYIHISSHITLSNQPLIHRLSPTSIICLWTRDIVGALAHLSDLLPAQPLVFGCEPEAKDTEYSNYSKYDATLCNKVRFGIKMDKSASRSLGWLRLLGT